MTDATGTDLKSKHKQIRDRPLHQHDKQVGTDPVSFGDRPLSFLKTVV
ncbi:MAG: hypothetical protein LBQ77_06800 [Treponema sp.]|nr:hypothetical protein [Treponema sp.]